MKWFVPIGLQRHSHVPGGWGVFHLSGFDRNASWVLGQGHAGETNWWKGSGLPCLCMGLLQPQRLQVHESCHRKVVHIAAQWQIFIKKNRFQLFFFFVIWRSHKNSLPNFPLPWLILFATFQMPLQIFFYSQTQTFNFERWKSLIKMWIITCLKLWFSELRVK